MVDPMSDHAEDVDPEEAPDCATCGQPIANEPTHRVVTWLEGDSVRTVHFCDDECRLDWRRES